MTPGANASTVPAGTVEIRVASLLVGRRLLLARLRRESERQVAFSEAKRLFLEAVSTIDRLETDLARVTAELESVRGGDAGDALR
jgi:hypothetical protein